MRCLIPLTLSLMCATAFAEHGTLRIDSDLPGARVILGATYLGQTPLEVVLPAGQHRLRVSAVGDAPTHHLLTLDPGAPKRWRAPTTRRGHGPPTDAPPWLATECRGILSCGLGASDHPSPVMAEPLSLVRAIAEAAEGENGRAVPRRADAIDAVRFRVVTQVVRRVRRVRRWIDLEGTLALALVMPGLPTPVTASGAADPRTAADQQRTLARLAAMVRALRWWFALKDGADLQVESTVFDPTPVGEMFARSIEVSVRGTLGEEGHDLALLARLRDRQAVRRTAGDGRAIDEEVDDVIDVQIRQHGVRHVVRVRNGVATIETHGKPADVLADLERVVGAARIQTAYAPEQMFDGVPIARAILK